MTQIRDEYLELVSLTKQYILQEKKSTDWVESESETYQYFKKQALEKKGQVVAPVAPPAPVVAKPAPAFTVPKPPVVSPPEPVQSPQQIKPIVQEVVIPIVSAPVVETPPAPKVEAKTVAKKGSSFELEPFGPPPVHDLGDLRKIVLEKFPQQQILDEPPSDLAARQINGAWQKQASSIAVLILSFNEPPKQKAFLANLAKAINVTIAPAVVVNAHKFEAEKSWGDVLKSADLKLVIATDYGIYALPELMKHYRDQPREAKHFLDKTPLCLLSDLSIYLKEPRLKPSLWKAILHTLEQRTS